MEPWWRDTGAVAIKRPQNTVKLVIGLDGNASVGSATFAAIGAWQAEEEDAQGMYLHAVLNKLNLFLPATMPGTARDEDD